MWDPQRLRTLWVFTACYRDSVTYLLVVWEAGWASEPVWTLWRREKYFALSGNRIPAIQHVAHHYTDSVRGIFNFMSAEVYYDKYGIVQWSEAVEAERGLVLIQERNISRIAMLRLTFEPGTSRIYNKSADRYTESFCGIYYSFIIRNLRI
jgi:hypothetical protein